MWPRDWSSDVCSSDLLYDTADPDDRTTPSYNRMMYATTDDFTTFSEPQVWIDVDRRGQDGAGSIDVTVAEHERSEEHTSELQSRGHLVCRLLLEKKKKKKKRAKKVRQTR